MRLICPQETAMPKIPSPQPRDLSGKWVVELPSMPEDYQFGPQQGEINGWVDEVWPKAVQLFGELLAGLPANLYELHLVPRLDLGDQGRAA
jgi:hypothetical protein